jgi:Tfp pilus assembly major pilin PilA
MRVFSLLSLLIVLAIVLVLAKRQLSDVQSVAAKASEPESSEVAVPEVRTPQQAQMLEQRVKDDVDRATQDHAQQMRNSIDEATGSAGKP